MIEKEMAKEVANVLKRTARGLKENPMNVYLLKDTEKDLENIINEKYSNVPDAKFLMFLYVNFRYHLWNHIAADASLRVSDEQTEQIIEKVAEGLNMLAEALEVYNKEKIYDALKYMIFNYLAELNRVVEI